jgi:membrane dipeptidase
MIGRVVKLSKYDDERALSVHSKATVIVAHSHVAICGIAERRGKGESHVFDQNFSRSLREGGVNAILESVGGTTMHLTFPLGRYLASSASNHLKRTLILIEMMLSELESCEVANLAKSTEDIRASKRDGKIAIMMGFEGIDPIEDDIGLLRIFHRLGVRSIQLAWLDRNRVADSVFERTNSGLTNFGLSVVEELNKTHMIIDVSHISEKGFTDVLGQTRDPVIASHSNARALLDHPRNLSDEQIKALANNGGVMGVNVAGFVSKNNPTIGDVLNHVDHVVKLVGMDHIGIGLDITENFDKEIYSRIWKGTPYNFPFSYAEGIDNMSRVSNLTKGLVARGYSDQDIMKFLGGNFLRVFEKIFGS